MSQGQKEVRELQPGACQGKNTAGQRKREQPSPEAEVSRRPRGKEASVAKIARPLTGFFS